MNGLCSACQNPVEVVDFRLGEGVVLVRCPACGKAQRLSLTEASADTAVAPLPKPSPALTSRDAPPPVSPGAGPIEPDFEAPGGFCPKCISPRRAEAASCPSCGLVFAKALSQDFTVSSSLASAFRALAARWQEPPAHARFLQLAAETGELASAGRLYRIRMARTPEDMVARASLEATVKMASAPVSVAAIKVAPGVDTGRHRKLLLMAMTFLGPSLLFLLVRLLGRH
jgi:hypothetical protein